MGQTLVMPASVPAVNNAALTIITVCVSSINRFLLNASARTPPGSEERMIGTARKRPTRPSANADFVSLYTCQLIATNCICDPVTDTIRPSQRSRKSWWRKAAKAEWLGELTYRRTTGLTCGHGGQSPGVE